MDIQRVDAGRNNRKGLKCGSKDEVKQKADNNNIAMRDWYGYSWEAVCGNAMEKLEICDCDIVHDECKVDYNGIEAADGKANSPKNGIGHQYEIDIGKDEVKPFIDYQKLSVMKNVSGSCNYGRCNEIEKKYTRNGMLFISNYSMDMEI
ncbi:hypothetical protein F8M41_009625 [Gigaspora margarita]|uniref:Uncharacterized protein n=1 Tax=Gigaspora margarita TaxID=4874 RepID=A0A8H3X2P9_GIGMA|nr:hypothetical protein F8M41_009625 [Gigaspora margarita]